MPETMVAFLARDWTGDGPLDLSDRLVVVPTRQAGRRLREGLARHAASHEAAVLPPLVVTPNHLFSPGRLGEAETPTASPQAAALVWTALLWRAPLAAYRRAFPVDPVDQDLLWAAGNARELLAVRDLLVESGLDFAAAAARLAEEEIEAARWADFARLEAAAGSLFAELGLRDPGSASLEAAARGTLPNEIRQIIVAAVPDLRPLAATALERYASSLPVDLLVPAPEAEAESFDGFGRPRPEAWAERIIDFAEPEQTLHACETPAALAARCRGLLSAYDDPSAYAAIGLPDPDLAPTLEQALAEDGIATYDPAGRALAREGAVHLLRLVLELVGGARFAAFRGLLRCPGFAAATLPGDAAEPVPTGRILDEADRLAAEHLPLNLDAARAALRRHPGREGNLAALLEGAETLATRLQRGNFTDELCAFLGAVFRGKRLADHDPEKAVLTEIADAIHTLEADLATTASLFPKAPGASERLNLLLASLAQRQVYPERGHRDLDLLGWLELLWEDAPHLLVAGMNDHAVPESVVGHAFLPDSARTLLGVPDNEARFARDAFVLAVLVETRRRGGGRLDLLFGRLTSAGDPLRPSRLLFRCPDGELAARTLRLFRGGGEAPVPPARTVAWRLRPRPLPAEHRLFQRIRATAFRDYLACPFRYYLRHGLGMASVAADKSELDAMDFGNLVHAALEAYGRDESMRGCADAKAIAARFEEEIERWFSWRFGPRLSTPLLIQREAARRRLGHWAALEAEQRAAGWEIVEVESEIGSETHPFQIGGMAVGGRIDRVERHPSEGLRVFDFKTSSSMENGRPRMVALSHLVPLRRGEDPDSLPPWATTQNAKGVLLRWTNLQLPLYRMALSARFPGKPVAVGYISLGRTLEEIRLDPWSELDEALMDSARTCAEGVVAAIREARFWPPNDRMPHWDEFHGLLSPTAEEAVDPSEIVGAASA